LINKHAEAFVQKRATKHSKKLFLYVLEYVVFCYKCLRRNNAEKQVCYSKSYCRNHTSFFFEDWLKVRLIEDYLQQLRSYFHYSGIKDIRFESETEKIYKDGTGKIKKDKIDIYITNLGLQRYWANADIVEEDLYFTIECKRLRDTSKNAEESGYLSDIRKFVEREYKFRFPFTGMVGFVEKGSMPIEDIINDINKRLQKSSTIHTTQELTPFEVKDFQYCRLSKHRNIFLLNRSIEVYHLFLDYSRIIIE
jgi:hypothetical protein